MAGRSTALVAVGSYSTGPFATRDWKIKHTVTLFEKHRAVWVTSPIGSLGYGEPPQEPAAFPFGWTLAQELIVVIAACAVKDEEVLTALEAEGLVAEAEGFPGHSRKLLRIEDVHADGPPLPTHIVELSATCICNIVRLGLVRLEANTALGDGALVELRSYGLDVTDYQLQPLGESEND